MTYCFDTGPLIWFVKRVAAAGQAQMIHEAREFVIRAEQHADRIFVPATALHEFMVQGDLARRAAWLAAIEEGFEIAAFDAAAANLAGELEAGFYGGRPDVVRNLRMDIQIVATALRWKADAVVSYDADIRAIAEGKIPICGFEERDSLLAE